MDLAQVVDVFVQCVYGSRVVSGVLWQLFSRISLVVVFFWFCAMESLRDVAVVVFVLFQTSNGCRQET